MKLGKEKCQKPAKIEKKVLFDLVRFLEFKGKEYQEKKIEMFNSRIAKENGKRFRAECDRRLANMFRGLGVTGLDDIIRQTEENVRQSKTCKLCHLYCANYHILESHRNSQKCKKRQAEQKGENFVMTKDTRKYCEICDKSILHYNWTRHLEGNCHREHIRILREPAFMCTVCDKIFEKGARPKRMLQIHMRSKKHLKKLNEPGNQSKHDALVQKHFVKVV